MVMKEMTWYDFRRDPKLKYSLGTWEIPMAKLRKTAPDECYSREGNTNLNSWLSRIIPSWFVSVFVMGFLAKLSKLAASYKLWRYLQHLLFWTVFRK